MFRNIPDFDFSAPRKEEAKPFWIEEKLVGIEADAILAGRSVVVEATYKTLKILGRGAMLANAGLAGPVCMTYLQNKTPERGMHD